MAKMILDEKERSVRTIQLIHSSFDDYISSRFLLINNYPVNGIVLGSMAVEKYLKAILVFLTGEVKKIHFDSIDRLKADFNNTDYKDIFNQIDTRFIELLSSGYSLRYYDNFTKPITIGFVTNQVIAELDLFIAQLDSLTDFDTTFKQSVQSKDVRICDYNYLAYGWDKKEFCERECHCHGIYIDPLEPHPIRIKSIKGVTPYNGTLTTMNVKIESK